MSGDEEAEILNLLRRVAADNSAGLAICKRSVEISERSLEISEAIVKERSQVDPTANLLLIEMKKQTQLLEFIHQRITSQ